jgi:site-specific DNA-cytosine methylase
MENGINVLSFFDGISAGQEALRQLGVKVNRYIAIEIDQSAIAITQANFPKTEQRGDILLVHTDMKNFVAGLPKIDLIFAGSPCQGFSKVGNKKAFKDPRSKLFVNFAEILSEIKMQQKTPDIPFFFENVVMDAQWADEISKALGVREELYDSVHYSPNARARYYWTNLNPPRAIVEKYKQQGGWKTYQDVMSPIVERKNMIPHTTKGKNKYKFVVSRDNDFGLSLLGSFRKVKKDGKLGEASQPYRVYRTDSKMCTFLAEAGGWGAKAGLYSRKVSTVPKGVFTTIDANHIAVVPTPETCLEAMGFPRSYYDGVYTLSSKNKKRKLTKNAKYKGFGNSWHVTVVKLLIEWYCRSSGWIKR